MAESGLARSGATEKCAGLKILWPCAFESSNLSPCNFSRLTKELLNFNAKICLMEEEIGQVTHYYDKASVAVVKLSGKVSRGSWVVIKGKETNFQQIVSSLQLENISVDLASVGDTVGMKVEKKVSAGDRVFKLM